MSSLVLELQHDALSPTTKVTDLLRKALVVASKLNVPEFKQWVEDELQGYKGKGLDTPKYRHLKGEIKAAHPNYGFIPYNFEDPEMAETLSVRPTHQPIGELQHLLEKLGPKGVLTMPFSPKVVKQLDSGNLELGIVPTVLIDSSRIHGILDAVRNIVLQWSLKLEAEGIIGEGLTFSKEEKKKAASVTYNIQHFTGIAGTVHAGNLQIGDYGSIHQELKTRGISQQHRNELECILDQLETAKGHDRESLLKQGSDWVLAHSKELGELAKVLTSWFGGS